MNKDKSIRLDKPIYSLRNNQLVEIQEVVNHYHKGLMIHTKIGGQSSIKDVYKYGANETREEIDLRLHDIKVEVIKRITDYRSYCTHLQYLDYSITEKTMFSTEYNFTLNGNALFKLEFDMRKENINNFLERFNAFLDGMKYGLIINGR